MKEFWNKALDNIDEKYIAKTAQKHLKHLDGTGDDYIDIHDAPIKLTPQPQKQSRKGLIIGSCSAAAAVAVCAIGGSLWFGRQNVPVSSEPDTGSSVTSTDSSIPTDENGNIIFSEDYTSGHIEFQPLEPFTWLGSNGVESSFGDMTDKEIHEYIEGFSGVNHLYAHNALVSDRFERGECRWNALYETYPDMEYVSLYYTKEDDQLVIINIGEETGNFHYVRTSDSGDILVPDIKRPNNSWLKKYIDGDKTEIYVGGKVIDGVPYYNADLELEYEGKPIYCNISARGCSIENITDVLGGIVCNINSLTRSYSEKRNALIPEEYYAFSISDPQLGWIGYNERLEERLTEVFSNHEELGEPLFNIEPPTAHNCVIQCFMDHEGNITELLRLHKTEDGKYYYSLSYNNIPTYYEISEQFFNSLHEVFNAFRPYEIAAVVEEISGGGSYVASGYRIHSDTPLEIGNDVKIVYYGDVRETYPMQIDQVSVRKYYNIIADETPMNWAEVSCITDMDWDVFEEYFAGTWNAIDTGYEDTLLWNYRGDSDFMLYRDGYGIKCAEREDGYYFSCMRAGQPEGYFIHKEYPDIMYMYAHFENEKHCDYIRTYVKEEHSPWLTDLDIMGKLNYLAYAKLCSELGNGFGSKVAELHEGFTDDNGTVWCKSPSLAQGWGDMTLLSNTGDAVAFTDLFYKQEELTEDTLNGKTDPQGQYFLIKLVLQDGEWVLERAKPSENGSETPTSFSHVFEENYGDFVVTLRYNVIEQTNGSQMLEDIEYLIAPADNISKQTKFYFSSPVLAGAPIDNVMPAGLEISVKSARLPSGDLFLVYVPANEDIYVITVISCTEELMRSVGYIETRSLKLGVNGTEDIITLENTEGTATSYRVDFENFTLKKVTEPENIEGEVTFYLKDQNKRAEGMSAYVSYFNYEWGSERDMLDLRPFSQDIPFSLKTPCLGWDMDSNGAYMYGEHELWFIPKNDNKTMYYFEGLGHGDTVSLSDYTDIYRRTSGASGWMAGSIPLNVLGQVDLELTYGVDLDWMEYTDENGTRWIRNGDPDIDWGYVVSADVYSPEENFLRTGEDIHIKMMNADDPSEMKYISFRPILTEEEGVFILGDEHYTFDVSICDPALTPTQRMSDVQTNVDRSGHGMLTMPVQFFPVDGERYYAVRRLGSNQQQWLTDTEIYFHDENGYTLIKDFKEHSTVVMCEGRLYLISNKQVTCFDGIKEISSVTVSEEPLSPHSGAIILGGRYILESSAWCILYDTVTEKYIDLPESDVKHNADDSITLVIDGTEHVCSTDSADTLSKVFG